MMPRPHRRRSSKESRARRCDLFDLVNFCLLVRFSVGFATPSPAAMSLPVTDYFAYGYPSRH
jgi:hypothetical protein